MGFALGPFQLWASIPILWTYCTPLVGVLTQYFPVWAGSMGVYEANQTSEY